MYNFIVRKRFLEEKIIQNSNNSDFEEEYNRCSDDQNDHGKKEAPIIDYTQLHEHQNKDDRIPMYDTPYSDSCLRSTSRSVSSDVYKKNYRSSSEDCDSERSHSEKFKTRGFSQSKRNHDLSEPVKRKGRGKYDKKQVESIQMSNQEHRSLGFHLPTLDDTSSDRHSDSASPDIHKRKYENLSDDSEEEGHDKKFKKDEYICKSENSYGGRSKISGFSTSKRDYDSSQSMAKCSNSKRKSNNVMEHTGYQKSKNRGKYSQNRLETMQCTEQQEHRSLGFHLPGLDDTSTSQRSDSASSDNRKRKYKSSSDENESETERQNKHQAFDYSIFDTQCTDSTSPEMYKRNHEQIFNLTQSTTQCSTAKKTGNIAADMMKKMGYQEGKGLGKHEQGRLEPVQAAKQHGHRGLGLHLPSLGNASIKWDPKEEEIKVKEDMEWITNTDINVPTLKEMDKWIVMGPAKKTIDDETNFCSPETVRHIIESKTVFDNLDKKEMHRARTRSNPFETIRGAFFLNRAAVKMANIDKACDFMFTNPKNLKSNELLYFADVCAGPGGFSEYVLWRKKWRAKGFGFTLKNENDFKLDDFYAGPCETFHPFYGPKENGDVFDPENQDAFRNVIMKHTNNMGVHFMMSDGGFSVSGQENIQEILSKQLYLCQCLVALMIVRPGGHFVTKVFDLFTPFSAGLIYLMYRCFDEVCIFKPNTSRPANSERYLICKRKRQDTYEVMRYLRHVNQLLLKRNSLNDVMQIVPLDKLESEKQFIEYLRTSNDILGRKQITGLLKIAAYCRDTSLIETRQATMKKECLQYWELPDESRVAPNRGKPQERLRSVLKVSVDFLSIPSQKLTQSNVDSTVASSPYDWFCVPCSTGSCTDEDMKATFYMSMGRSKVYRYIRSTWVQLNENWKLELPPDTLIYAEAVWEMRKEGRSQRKTVTLHIIDAYVLGREDISNKYIQERHELIKMFCEALWKPYAGNYGRIRAKELHPVDHRLAQKLRLIQRPMKKSNMTSLTYDFERTYLDDDEGDGNECPSYFILNSVLFLKSTCFPWSRHWSKKTNFTYVFNSKTRLALFDRDRPKEAEASFLDTFKNRYTWHWPNDRSLSMEELVKEIRVKCPQYSEQL